MQELITIKSCDGAIEIWINKKEKYNIVRDAILEKLSSAHNFYFGAEKVVIFGNEFSSLQKREIKKMLFKTFDMRNTLFADEDTQKTPEENQKSTNETVSNSIALISDNYYDKKCIFVSNTLRNGQRVECEGDVVVLGDINAGAEVIAGGNIAVFGKLIGLAHAGATGRKDVCIVANELSPQQIRMSGKIAILPKRPKNMGTEMASLVDGKIVIHHI